jgi:valyl-tRNA synthetase
MEEKIFALNLALTRANEHNANQLADIQSLHSEVTSLRQTMNVLVSQNAKESVQRGMSAAAFSEALIIANEHNLKHLAKIQSLQSQNTELIGTMHVTVMGIAQDDLSALHGRMHS